MDASNYYPWAELDLSIWGFTSKCFGSSSGALQKKKKKKHMSKYMSPSSLAPAAIRLSSLCVPRLYWVKFDRERETYGTYGSDWSTRQLLAFFCVLILQGMANTNKNPTTQQWLDDNIIFKHLCFYVHKNVWLYLQNETYSGSQLTIFWGLNIYVTSSSFGK